MTILLVVTTMIFVTLIAIEVIKDKLDAIKEAKEGYWKWERVYVSYKGEIIGTTISRVWHSYADEQLNNEEIQRA